jgi:hypothetical protein
MKSPDSLLHDVIWGVQHDAFDDRLGRSLLRAWQVGAADEVVTNLIQSRLHPLKMQEAFGTLNPFRKPQLRDGNVVLGLDFQGNQIRIKRQSGNAGMLILSRTGGGKSNLISWLTPQIAGERCNVWISDLYKKQMRHLLPFMARVGKRLVILRASDWKSNLLESRGRDARLHQSFATDLLARILDLPSRARSILNQAVHELYQQFGIWNGNQDAWPCLFDLYEWVWRHSDLNAAAREAILDRLGSLLISLTPRCAAYRRAWQASDLAQHSIIFELRDASETVKQVLLESTLFTLFHDEIERGAFNVPMDLFVIFEDGQRFFSTQTTSMGSGLTPMDELAGVIRGSGKGLCVSVQTMQGLSRRLVPNLAMKIMGRLGTHEDYASLGADMNMNAAQIEWTKRNSIPGLFVCQMADGEWREPFPFRVPLLSIPATVSDDIAARSLQPLNSIPVVPAPEFARWQPRQTVEVRTQQSSHLSEAELRLLQAVIRNPARPCSFYASAARISGKRAGEMRERLVAAGYLREHQLATGRRGRTAIVLEPLEPAFSAVADAERSGIL